jgi:hypothetical protein
MQIFDKRGKDWSVEVRRSRPCGIHPGVVAINSRNGFVSTLHPRNLSGQVRKPGRRKLLKEFIDATNFNEIRRREAPPRGEGLLAFFDRE